ncbi:hypothetical protein ACOMHN_027086 [Nucella lapillus]
MSCPKSVFITGASRGLGLSLVQHILSLPSMPEHIFAACRDPSSAGALQSLAQKNSHLKIVALDVADDSSIQTAYQKTASVLEDSGLNLLINNAGINDKTDKGSLELVTRDRIQSHFNINATAPVMMTQKFLPLLKMAAEGNKSHPMSCQRAAVVHISSIMGSVQCSLDSHSSNAYHYRMSKAAVNMAAALMTSELKGLGILVAAVHPGWVKTDMGGSAAPLDMETSVRNVWSLLTKMDAESSGQLHSHDGSILPW